VLACGALLSALAIAGSVHRVRKGQCALAKWIPAIEDLWRGRAIYGREPGSTREGFPAPPLTAIVLTPFAAAGPKAGAIAWGLVEVALAWWIVASAFALAAGRASRFPPWAALAVLALSARVLLSEVAHGNVNMAVGATVAASARAWRGGRELRAGLWAALGAALKVTPALLVAYFLWKRSPRALAGAGAGLVAFLAVPALLLGWSFNLELLAGWWRQMAEPYLGAAPLSVVQTEHTNQSYLGVLARLTSDSVAIRARPPAFEADVAVNLVSLPTGALRAVHLALAAATLAVLALALRVPRAARGSAATLGELSMVALAMAFLSERSWKHHYVLLALPLAYLAWTLATRPARDRVWWTCAAALALSAVLNGLTGSGVLGDRGSDLAEAYGAWLWGALALFAACAVSLLSLPPTALLDEGPRGPERGRRLTESPKDPAGPAR
jgi:alpha-1,2-mannosyltransferase